MAKKRSHSQGRKEWHLPEIPDSSSPVDQIDIATQTDSEQSPERSPKPRNSCANKNKATKTIKNKKFIDNNISKIFETKCESKTKLRLQKALQQKRQNKATSTNADIEPYDPGSPNLFHDDCGSADGKDNQTNSESLCQCQCMVTIRMKPKASASGKFRYWVHLNHFLNCDTKTCQSYKTLHDHFLQAGRVTTEGLILIKPANRRILDYKEALVLLLCPKASECRTCSAFMRHVTCIELFCECNCFEGLRDIFLYLASFIEEHRVSGKLHDPLSYTADEFEDTVLKNMDDLFHICLNEMEEEVEDLKISHLSIVITILKGRVKKLYQKHMPCDDGNSFQAKFNKITDEDVLIVFDELDSAGIISKNDSNNLFKQKAGKLRAFTAHLINKHLANEPFEMPDECDDKLGELRKKFRKMFTEIVTDFHKMNTEKAAQKRESITKQRINNCSPTNWYEMEKLDKKRLLRMKCAVVAFSGLLPQTTNRSKEGLPSLTLPPTVLQRLIDHSTNCYMCHILGTAYLELHKFTDVIVPDFCKLDRQPNCYNSAKSETRQQPNARQIRKICPCKPNLTSKQLRGIQKDYIENMSSGKSPATRRLTYCQNLANVLDVNLVHVGTENNRYINASWVMATENKYSYMGDPTYHLGLRRSGLYPDEDWEAEFCRRLNTIFSVEEERKAKLTKSAWGERVYEISKMD